MVRDAELYGVMVKREVFSLVLLVLIALKMLGNVFYCVLFRLMIRKIFVRGIRNPRL